MQDRCTVKTEEKEGPTDETSTDVY